MIVALKLRKQLCKISLSVCLYVHTYVRMVGYLLSSYVCVFVRFYESMNLCICVGFYVCIDVFMYVCIYV